MAKGASSGRGSSTAWLGPRSADPLASTTRTSAETAARISTTPAWTTPESHRSEPARATFTPRETAARPKPTDIEGGAQHAAWGDPCGVWHNEAIGQIALRPASRKDGIIGLPSRNAAGVYSSQWLVAVDPRSGRRIATGVHREGALDLMFVDGAYHKCWVPPNARTLIWDDGGIWKRPFSDPPPRPIWERDAASTTHGFVDAAFGAKAAAVTSHAAVHPLQPRGEPNRSIGVPANRKAARLPDDPAVPGWSGPSEESGRGILSVCVCCDAPLREPQARSPRSPAALHAAAAPKASDGEAEPLLAVSAADGAVGLDRSGASPGAGPPHRSERIAARGDSKVRLHPLNRNN